MWFGKVQYAYQCIIEFVNFFGVKVFEHHAQQRSCQVFLVLVGGWGDQLAGDGLAVVPVLLQHLEHADVVNELYKGGVGHVVYNGLVPDPLCDTKLGVGVYHHLDICQYGFLLVSQHHLVRVVHVQLEFLGRHLAG